MANFLNKINNIDGGKNLLLLGLSINGKTFTLEITAFVCDTPAKADVLNVQGHTASNSCTKCVTMGGKIDNTLCFPPYTSQPRKYEDFLAQTDHVLHKGKTILIELEDLDLIKIFRIDTLCNIPTPDLSVYSIRS